MTDYQPAVLTPTNGYLANVRQQPTTASGLVMAITAPVDGEYVPTAGDGMHWVPVRINGASGFMRADVVTIVPDDADITPDTPVVDAPRVDANRLYSAWLTLDELAQVAVLHHEIALVYENALKRAEDKQP